MEYRNSIVGRHHEQDIMQMCYDSPRAELVAVYGRRRIGKTYLVKHFFKERFDFYATGVYEVSRSGQLKHWQEQLQRYSGVKQKATLYRRIVELLATRLTGMTRKDMAETLKLTDNGTLTEVLDNLVRCDFLRRYQTFGKKDYAPVFQLTDMYTLFYLRFVKSHNGQDEHAWTTMSSGVRNEWAGYAFEQVCILHVAQIKAALGITGIASDVCAWQYRSAEQRAQIDLVIDRSDRNIDLCEMKYSDSEYELKRDHVEWMLRRRDLFREATRTTKSLRLTLITAGGIKQGKHLSSIQGKVGLDDLFR